MYKPREGPRFEYREQEKQRVMDAPTMADKFPQLKALTLNLAYFNPAGLSKNAQVKFMPNLANARAVFRLDCPNNGCIGGDFDLTDALAEAIAHHRTTVSAEACCEGWQSKTTIDKVRCGNILRYTMKLDY
jgi:hypothetical protein